MKYKRICIVLGIIIALSFVVLAIKSVRADIEIKKNIESRINLSEEEKRAFKYNQMVDDIKAVENGSQLRHAKPSEGKKSDDIVSLTVAKYYFGDGYTVKYTPAADALIYEFYVGENPVYTVVTSTGWGKDGNTGTLNILVSKLINYSVFTLMIVAELVFFVLYKKSLIKENKDVKEDTNTFENEKSNIENK